MGKTAKTGIAVISLCSIGLLGCTNDRRAEIVEPSLHKDIEVVSYHDRNGDGKADLEVHRFPDIADRDWELRDDDYNGRFEKKITLGVGIFESVVDLPVPPGVIKIEK